MSRGAEAMSGRATAPASERTMSLKSGVSPGRYLGSGMCKESGMLFFMPFAPLDPSGRN